jgi:hypothetical protein
MLHAWMTRLHGHLGWERLGHHHRYGGQALLVRFREPSPV